MFDEKFLSEIGMDLVPEEEKQDFLRKLQEELEIKVGNELGRRLNAEQLAELEALIEGDEWVVRRALSEFNNYEEDELYRHILEKQRGGMKVDENDLESVMMDIEAEKIALRSYLKAKLLQKYCPEVDEVVGEIISQIKEDLLKNIEG